MSDTPTAAVQGPLAAALVHPDREPPGDGIRLIYADLDLAERADLRRSLGLSSAEASTDDSLILAAYRRWGPGAASRLGGQFAFAIWDGTRRAVVAARDPVGLRPLFWSSGADTVVVGGDLRALLQTGAVPDDLDDDMMAGGLLDGGFKPSFFGRTYLRAINDLRGGHRLRVDAGGPHVEPYWRPEDAPRLALRNIDEVGDALRALLREVVRESIAGEPAGTLGAHVSAGIDSTTVASFVAEALDGEALHAFSWLPPPVPGEALPTELRLVDALSRRWNLSVTHCPPALEHVTNALLLDATRDPTTMWASEAPVRRAAQAAGVRTLLSGWGGDEAISFSGRGMVARHLVRSGRIAPVLAMIARDPVSAIRRARFLRSRSSDTGEHSPLDERRLAILEGKSATVAQLDLLRRARIPELLPPPADPRSYMAWLLTRGHLGRRAGAWARAGAAHGLKYRYPLLDRRVLAFALGLPLEVWLTRHRKRRWPLRAAGEGLVPDAIRLGGKGEPRWIEAGKRSKEGLVERIAPLVTPNAAGDRARYVDVPAVQHRLAQVLQKQTTAQRSTANTASALGAVGFLALGDALGPQPSLDAI